MKVAIQSFAREPRCLSAQPFRRRFSGKGRQTLLEIRRRNERGSHALSQRHRIALEQIAACVAQGPDRAGLGAVDGFTAEDHPGDHVCRQPP